MSEFTDYFAVKADKIDAVIQKLREARITCFVDNAEYFPGYPLKDDEGSWFLVSVYAEISWMEDGNYYYIDRKLKEIAGLFEKVLSLFEDEDMKTWRIEVYWKGSEIFKHSFEAGQNSNISGAKLKTLAEFFGIESEKLTPCLRFGNMDKFCNVLKIPYVHMSSTVAMPCGEEFYTSRGYAVDVRDLEV